MKPVIEIVQSLLLQFSSLFTQSGDVREAGCLLTGYLFSEYHEAVCEEPTSWEEVRREVQFHISVPKGSGPFPGIILIHGSSPAFSGSMIKRRDVFLEQGYAVMILNSFTRARWLKDCFSGDIPCQTYQKYFEQYQDKDQTDPDPAQCPTNGSSETLQPSLKQAYIDRTALGHTLTPAKRTLDFFEALEVMKKDPRIDESHLSVIGYSHGGSVVLEALTMVANNLAPPGLEQAIPEDTLKGLNAAIVYYPNCRPGSVSEWYQAIVPVPMLMLLAKHDEFVSPVTCSEMAESINQNAYKKKIEVLKFDNRHAFDMPEYETAYDPRSEAEARGKATRSCSRHYFQHNTCN